VTEIKLAVALAVRRKCR